MSDRKQNLEPEPGRGVEPLEGAGLEVLTRPQDLPFSECTECGSKDVAADSVLRGRPSITAVILFGWVFLLVRAALVKKTAVCRECGASQRYHTDGALFARCVLAILVILVLIGIWAYY